MKHIGVLGTGKTGSEVSNCLIENAYKITEFNRSNKFEHSKAKDLDGIICFLPGEAFLECFDELAKTKLPLVIGSTGYKLSEKQQATINSDTKAWVVSSNFAISMAIAKFCIEQIAQWSKSAQATDSIHEVHHKSKIDSPSGTALFWEQWIKNIKEGAKIEISSDRLEDVPGTHKYKATCPSESLEIVHTAKNRKIFAQGAVWALETIGKTSSTGLVDFFEMVKEHYTKGTQV